MRLENSKSPSGFEILHHISQTKDDKNPMNFKEFKLMTLLSTEK